MDWREDEAKPGGVMNDVFGASWTAVVAWLPLTEEWDRVQSNWPVWAALIAAVCVVSFAGWVYSRHRGLTDALREDYELNASVLGELLDERKAVRQTLQPRSKRRAVVSAPPCEQAWNSDPFWG